MRMFRLRAISQLLSDVYAPITPVNPTLSNKTIVALHLNGVNNGTLFPDETGRVFTASGNVKTQTAVSRFDGSSAYFDGASDYIATTKDNDFTLSGDFSIEAWVNPSTLPSVADIMGTATNKAYLGANLGGWVLAAYNGVIKLSYQYNNVLVFEKTFSGSLLHIGSWTHVAVCRINGIIKLFLDGVENATALSYAGDLVSNTYGLRIGGGAGGDTYWYAGYLQDVRIANGYSHYSENFTVSDPFTFALPESMNENVAQSSLFLKAAGAHLSTNKTILDSSSRGRTITPVSYASQGPVSPFAKNWSTFIDAGTSLVTGAGRGGLINMYGAYTFECWFKATTTNPGTFLSTYSGTTVGRRFGIASANSVVYCRKDGTAITIPLSKSFIANKWNHIAFVCADMSYTKVYLNGEHVGTSGADSSSVNSTFNNYAINIGTLYSTYVPFVGLISNMRFSTSPRYLENFTPPEQAFTVGYESGTSFLACASNRFIINQGDNTIPLTVSGVSKIFNSSPFENEVVEDSGSLFIPSSGSYATVSGPASLDSSDFTVELWCYPQSLDAAQSLFGNYATGTTDTSFRIDIATTGAVQFSCPARISLSTSNFVQLNSWNHISLVRSGNTFSLYLNGVLGATSVKSYILSSAAAFSIGASESGSRPFLGGYIAGLDMRFGALRTAAFNPPTTPPVPDAVNSELLCNFANSSVVDLSGRCNPVLVGDTKLNKNITKSGNGSIQFDGSGDWVTLLTPNANEFIFNADFTIEAWVYFNVTTGAPQTIFGMKNGSTYFDFRWYGSNGAWQASLNGGSGTSLGGSVTQSTWIHAALVRRDGVIRLFINGKRTSITVANSNVLGLSGVAAYVGATSSNENVLNGYVEDVGVHQFAKYSSDFTPKASALIV